MQGRGRLPARRPAGRLAVIAARPRARLQPLDGPQRARAARGARAAGPPPRLRGAHPHRRRPPLRGRPHAQLRTALQAPRRRLELSLIRREVDEAMRATTETLSQMTNLLAVVSAPSLNTATIRHVEVLALQPQVVLVVIITSTGGVSKMLATFEQSGRPGPRGVGGGVPQRAARRPRARRADAPAAAHRPGPLAGRARVPRRASRRRSADLGSEGEDALYVEGTARLFATAQIEDAAQINEAGGPARAPRGAAARAARGARRARRVRAHRPRERDARRCTRWRSWPPATGWRSASSGTVSVIGPVRMDYAGAIATVREAAHELSRFVEDAYAEN